MNKNINELNQTIEKIICDFVKEFISNNEEIEYSTILKEIDEDHFETIKQLGIPQKGRLVEDVVNEMVNDVYPYGHHANHRRYFGFVPSNTTMLSWLGDILTTAFNRHAGGYANFPVGCNIENQVISWLCEKAGYDKKAGGLFVSGGSMANMSALTIARDHLLTEDTWHLGVAYVSSQTHSSVAKGLRVIGIGNKRIRVVPCNEHFEMDMNTLEKMIEEDKKAGLLPFTVIASAGTTNTGSIDPLEEIASICEKHQLWMHVDGAFGASILLSNTYRHLLKGIEKADSISWDAHKWLFQTYGCGMVLVKDKTNMLNSFHVSPEYLKDLERDDDCINPFDLGIELTRPARGLKLWLTLQVLGSDRVSDCIDHGVYLAKLTQSELEKLEDIEIVSSAKLAMINFRFNPTHLSEEEKDELNLQISKKIVDSGVAGIFTTILNGKKVLRMCAINPETTKEDIQATIQHVYHYYKKFV